MKSKSITFITILFALMLVGIILIQAWWIKRSFQLNSIQFDAAAYRALEGVVKQTEQKENWNFMHNSVGFDSIIHTGVLHMRRGITMHIGQKSAACSLVVDVTNNVSVFNDNGRTIVKVESQSGDNQAEAQSFVFNDKNTDDVEDAPNVNEKIGNIDTLIQKMIHIKNPDSLSAKPTEIEALISGQLLQNDLPDSFNFALVNSRGQYAYKSAGFPDTIGSYKVNLYPNDLFGRNIFLYVNIPGKLMHIHSGIWWAFLLSVLFIITLLLLFTYSIRMLIRHKNLLAAKNDFINHISHEIKTPLAGISLGADMLIEKGSVMTQEQINKTIISIKEQSTRLNKDMSAVLLNALVDENTNTRLADFNMVQTIRNSMKEFDLIVSQKNVKLTLQYPEETLKIKGNEMLWQKVFCNLIDNAIKFSNADPKIEIVVTKSFGNSLSIKITDNGKGINKEDLVKIFDKFYRSDYYKQSNIQGFGLGLNFVKKVVEMHKGIIKAESELGAGTTIIIEIPLLHA